MVRARRAWREGVREEPALYALQSVHRPGTWRMGAGRGAHRCRWCGGGNSRLGFCRSGREATGKACEPPYPWLFTSFDGWAAHLNEKVPLNWDDEDCLSPYQSSSRSTFYVNATAWSRGLEVTGGGTGVVSHAGLVLLRELADRTGLTAGLSAALPSPQAGHDRGRVFADLACAIADGARVISDFRVMGDQRELFGPVASVPTAWRALGEIAAGGDRRRRKVTAARRYAWARGTARHGALPPVQVADRKLEGVTCIRLDATVVTAHSDKELAEANFKGYGHHPLLAYCDNAGGEPLAWMLRKGSAGSNTAADHIAITDAAIAALPPAFRRNLMITVDGAGFSHKLLEHLDKLAARRGHTLIYSAGWELDNREKAVLRLVPEDAWEIAIDHRGEIRERRSDSACADARCGHRACWIEEAHVIELTGLLRQGPAGDQLEGWPGTMRIFARRERPHP